MIFKYKRNYKYKQVILIVKVFRTTMKKNKHKRTGTKTIYTLNKIGIITRYNNIKTNYEKQPP